MIDNLHAALNFTLGVGENFALLIGDRLRDFVDALLENPEEAVQDSRSPKRWSVCPAKESFPRGRGGRPHVRCRG
jgi:hypothetical protein